jgi:1,4-alpha-glucan branching enzyme
MRCGVELIAHLRYQYDGLITAPPWESMPPSGAGAAPSIKVMQGEQSNTSVVVGSGPDSMIVKFFRVLAAGRARTSR